MTKRICSLLLILAMFGMLVPMEVFASPQTHPNTYTNTGNQRADIIGVANTQLGYTEGSNNDTKYGDWYGLNYQPWCAMFVSWCARQANIPTSVLKNSSCAGHSESYFNIPYHDGSNYTPKSGDLFFTKSWSHVGLVDYVDGNYFYTIEGNSNTSGSSDGICVCRNRRYIPNFYFGVPNYQNNVVKPGKISDLSVSVGDGGKCTFRWSGVSNAKSYVVKIWRDKLWEGDSTYESYAESGHIAQLRAGSYIAYVDALNDSECVMSNTVSFTVSEISSDYLNASENYIWIRNIGTGNYLTVHDDGNVVSSPKDDSLNQIWQLEHLGNNRHRLTSVYNNKCLDVSGGGYKDETNVWTFPSNNSDAQAWYIFRTGNYVGLRPACSDNTVLDVYNNNKQSGTNVQLYSYHGESCQQFEILRKKYTVSYNANGGNSIPDAQTKYYNANLTLNSAIPVRDGYTFAGWNTKADGTGDNYTPGGQYTANASATLYAQWTQMVYLDLNGWIDGAEYGWIDNYGTVDVYINGNLVADDVTDFVQFYPAGTTYEIKDIKAKDGKKYLGVHSGSLSGTLNDNMSVYLDFLTLMCQLDVNGWLDGTVASALYDYGTVDVYINGKLVADDVSDFVHNYPMGTVYEIKDIKAKNGKQYNRVHAGSLSGTLNDNNFVYLDFATKKYTVSFNANGGTNAPAAQIKTENETLTLPDQTPSRRGYLFLGWSDDINVASATYQANGTFVANQDTTLYAVWKKIAPVSVAVKTKPTKITYNVGETLNTAGLMLTVIYNDASTKDISSGFTCTPSVLNTAGTQTVTVSYEGKTTSFNVTVNDKAELKITTQPKTAVVLNGGTVKFTVAASGDGLSYQWQISDDSGATWRNSAVKTATYTTTLSSKINGRRMRCVVSDKYGDSLTSNTVTMWMSGLKITTQPESVNASDGATVKFTVAANGDGVTYQWQISDDGGQSWRNSAVTSAVYTTTLTAKELS